MGISISCRRLFCFKEQHGEYRRNGACRTNIFLCDTAFFLTDVQVTRSILTNRIFCSKSKRSKNKSAQNLRSLLDDSKIYPNNLVYNQPNRLVFNQHSTLMYNPPNKLVYNQSSWIVYNQHSRLVHNHFNTLRMFLIMKLMEDCSNMVSCGCFKPQYLPLTFLSSFLDIGSRKNKSD